MTSQVEMRPVRGAFAHLLTNANYLPGLLVVHHGHLSVGSKYPFVAFVTSDVGDEVRRILVSRGIIVRDVEPLYPPEQPVFDEAYKRFEQIWTKLRLVDVTVFSRVLMPCAHSWSSGPLNYMNMMYALFLWCPYSMTVTILAFSLNSALFLEITTWLSKRIWMTYSI